MPDGWIATRALVIGAYHRSAGVTSNPVTAPWNNRLAMPNLAPGDTAPDFELPVRGKETVRLSTALASGPVVLLTYVFDFSPG
jgi:hypothetical protein